MPKIYKFTYGGTIASYPKSIPTYHVLGCADNIQGEFVTLESYQTQAAEIAKLQSQLEHLETVASGRLDEVAKLRGLLERWQKLAPLFYHEGEFQLSDKIDNIRTDTNEVLK